MYKPPTVLASPPLLCVLLLMESALFIDKTLPPVAQTWTLHLEPDVCFLFSVVLFGYLHYEGNQSPSREATHGLLLLNICYCQAMFQHSLWNVLVSWVQISLTKEFGDSHSLTVEALFTLTDCRRSKSYNNKTFKECHTAFFLFPLEALFDWTMLTASEC